MTEAKAKLSRSEALAQRMSKVASKNTGNTVSTVDTANIQQALSVVDQLVKSPGIFLDVDVDQIHKLKNPREVPCSLDDVKAVSWPNINESHENLKDDIASSLDAAALAFWTNATPSQKAEIVTFFEEIHTLAQSIAENSQIHNIVVQRDGPSATRMDLIAGERRVFAALYTRGLIKSLQAKVFNKLLEPLQIAKLTDQENTSKPLTPYEKLVSKLAILDSAPNLSSLKRIDLQKLLGSAAGEVSLIQRVAKSKDRAALLAYFKAAKCGWREVNAIMSSGVIPSTVDTPADETQLAQESETQEGELKTPEPEPQPKESAPVNQKLKQAGSFGLKLQSRTNLGVAQILLTNLKKSKDIPASMREELSALDFESPTSILEAWCIIAEYVEGQNQ